MNNGQEGKHPPESPKARQAGRAEQLCNFCVLNETDSLLAACQHEPVKLKKSKKQRDKYAVAAITKGMAQPRFVESARPEEEAAGHRLTKLQRRLG